VATVAGLELIGGAKSLNVDARTLSNTADRIRFKIQDWLSSSNLIWCTSPSNEDGTTTFALALAKSFADAGKTVALVDANLATPKLHCLLDQMASPGLLQVLTGQAQLAEVCRSTDSSLVLIPAGGVVENIHDLERRSLTTCFSELSNLFDVVVIDSCPSGAAEFGLHLPEIELNLLVILRLKHSLKSDWKRLTRELSAQKLNNVGIFVNGVVPIAGKTPPTNVAEDRLIEAVRPAESSKETVATW
jgi:Mrp family chromosome partitioning ATPase